MRIDDEAAAKWLAQPGRWVLRKDTIGELLVAILTTPRDKAPSLASLQSADAWTTPVARGWGGDRFFLLGSGSSALDAARALKELKGVWITVWDTPVDSGRVHRVPGLVLDAIADGDGADWVRWGRCLPGLR